VRKKRQSGRIIDYQATFSSERGRRVLLDLMKAHHMMSSTYSPVVREEIYIREGERNVILRILSFLNVDQKQLEELIREEANE
jgi:hypothetical protein